MSSLVRLCDCLFIRSFSFMMLFSFSSKAFFKFIAFKFTIFNTLFGLTYTYWVLGGIIWGSFSSGQLSFYCKLRWLWYPTLDWDIELEISIVCYDLLSSFCSSHESHEDDTTLLTEITGFCSKLGPFLSRDFEPSMSSISITFFSLSLSSFKDWLSSMIS